MNKEQDSKSCQACASCGKMCGQGMCCHGGCRRFWIKLVLGLLILAAVFCIGVKVGEFKGQFGYGYGNRMMRYHYQPVGAYPLGVPSGMMQNSSGYYMMRQPNASTTPAK